MRIIAFTFLFIMSGVCFAGDLPVSTQNEISHLFTFIKSSDCQFNRNGTWYPARDAADHIEKKYNYFLKKGKISSAETFIKLSASESSMSGNKYRVRCGSPTEIDSSVWLKTELLKYRSK